ncbi:substrate-binding periplasmic protein [Alteromonas sp. AMM-1]|uniref:substrate-binding periplasmic protein n=1 Tax=Alteromonas sp. AMM-1 TaxID=3394233 RepID=UPI0039A4B30D
MTVMLSNGVFADTSLMVFTESSPPYHYVENGKVIGEVTDKVRNIIARAGYTAEFKVFPWARAVLNTQRHNRALIFSIARTPERENQYQWIAPVTQFELGILALSARNDISISNWRDLTSYSVATQRGDIAEKWLKELGFKEGQNLIACADIVCSWEELKRGTVDFIIEDPRLVADTAELVGLKVTDVTMHQLIPELSVTAHLAASSTMPPAIVARLRRAANEIGYRP